MSLRLFHVSIIFIAFSAIGSAAQPTFDARQDIEGFVICQEPNGLVQIADTNGDGIPDVICNPMLLGNGDGTFHNGPSLNIPVTAVGSGLAVDVNGDGKVDLVYPDYESRLLGISVMLGNGDGSFQPPVFYPSSLNEDDHGVGGIAGYPIVTADFNGDGFPDAAILGTSEVILFLGHGDGTFNAQTPITLPYTNLDTSDVMLVGDANGDGRPDLMVDAGSALMVLLGNCDGTFSSPVTTSIAYNAGAGAMAVGDLNQDGILDAALQEFNVNTVSVFTGNGDGTFRGPVSISFPGDGPGSALAIADVNGDGIPDLVNTNVEVALGKGHGRFASPVYYAVNGLGLFLGGGGVGIGDLSNNGRLDLIIQDTGGVVSIFLNGGKGRFIDGVTTTVPGNRFACSATADFNGDGIPDLAISNSSAIDIYLGTGKAGAPFTAGATYTVSAAGCPVAGDLNGDGIQDLLVSSGNLDGAGAVIGFLGNGDGTFQQGPSSAIPSINHFVLADFNGDGKLDYATDTNLLAFGNGDGSFGVPFQFAGDVSLAAIGTADVNGDGKPDIVATSSSEDVFYTFLNTGNGTFGEASLNSCSVPNYLALGDLNGDGKPDLAIGCDTGVEVYLNNGHGFNPGKLLGQSDEPEGAGNVVIADLNGDGIADVALEGYANLAVFLGQGADTYAPAFYLGNGNAPEDVLVMNTHKQNPKHGTPDLVVTDESGVIYDLINETK